MASLQFLSGSRDQEVQDLSEAGSLTLGSGAAGVHVMVRDPGVAEQHCRIYPAQGNWWLQNLNPDTVLGKARVPVNEIRQLPDRAVFIVGNTYVKFWLKRPAAPAGGSPSGSGAVEGGAASEQLKRELAEAKTELDRLRGMGSQADGSRRELEKVKGELDGARREAEEQKRAAESAQGQVRDLEGKLGELRKQVQAESRTREEAEGKQRQTEAELTKARAEVETKAKEAEAKVKESERKAKDEAEKAKQAAERELEAAKKAVESELAAGKQAIAADKAALEAAAAADRAACEALRGREEARGRDRLAALRAGSDLHRALEALEVPEPLRRRLEAAVETEIDREVLRRVQGPLVPLRGLRVPGLDRDLEAELRAARRQSEQAEMARKLGLHQLEPAELERLLEAARA